MEIKVVETHLNLKNIAAITVGGLLLTLVFERLWVADYSGSGGAPLLALYIGPLVAVILAGYLSAKQPLSASTILLLCLGCCLLMMIPVFHHIADPFEYPGKNDPSLYSRAASYMVTHGTLCSHDNKLLDVPLGDHYLYQPGYKYYLAFLLLLSGGELTRFVQFYGIFVIVTGLVLMVALLGKKKEWKKYRWTMLFFIAITPAMIRNMLLGLTEWLAIMAMILSWILLRYKQFTLSILCIALAVFIRQNFLPMALVIATANVYQHREVRILRSILFLAVLLLPLWHNYYYAGLWKFFADYSWWPATLSMSNEAFFYYSMVIPYKQVFLQYMGIDLLYFSLPDMVMALLFIPIGWVAASSWVVSSGRQPMWRYLVWTVCLLLLVLPSLAFNGTAYFPRFQMFNFSAFFILFLMTSEEQLNHT